MDDWPALPYDDWRDTRDTLHMYTQIVGKLRLTRDTVQASGGVVQWIVKRV